MDKLISQEAAIAKIEPDEYYHSNEVKAMLEHLPAVDAAPVVHGRWENIETTAYGLCYATCSQCQYRCARDTVMGKVSEHFCKDCGARMDLPEGEEAREN